MWHQAYKQDHGLCKHAGCDKQRPTDKHDNRRTAYCFRHAKELDPVWHQAYELAHPRCQCNRVECQRGPAQQRFNLWCLQCVAVENPRDERLPLRNGLRAKESAVRVCLRQVGGFRIILTAPRVPNFNCDIVGAMTATPALKLWCEVQEGQHGHGQRVEGVPKGRYPRATESLKLLTTLNELLERCPHIVRIDFNPDGYQGSDGERIPSCWHGSTHVNPTQLATWEKRLATLVAVANVSFGVSPLCADNAVATAVKTSYERHRVADRLRTARGATVIELFHDAFDVSDPFARSFTIQLDGAKALVCPWPHPQPTPPLVTYTHDLSVAVDVMDPQALVDRREPHVKLSVIKKCIQDCKEHAHNAATQRSRDRATRLAARLESMVPELKKVSHWPTDDTHTHKTHFVRDGTNSASGKPWEEVALCTGRWGGASSGTESFSWLRCSSHFTRLALRDKQTEIDISACFNVIDAMFVISKHGSEGAASRCPMTLAYAKPGEADGLRVALAEALGLEMATEAARLHSTKKVVKPALLKIGNGFGQIGEGLIHNGLDLSSHPLPKGLRDELRLVRAAAREHPLVAPWKNQLLARAKERAKAKKKLEKYRNIGIDELIERSFLSHCRRLVEAHILALMIGLFGAEGFRTTCHVRPGFKLLACPHTASVPPTDAMSRPIAEARRGSPVDRALGPREVQQTCGGHRKRATQAEPAARRWCPLLSQGDQGLLRWLRRCHQGDQVAL